MQKEATVPPGFMVGDPYEADLVARAKERSAEAWDEIYARHYPPIYRYILARVFDAAVAEDLASAVFLGAVKGMGTYRYRGQPLLAWLYRIARNVVSSHQRTMFRQRTLSVSGVLELPGRLFGRAERTLEPAGPAAADPGATVERLDLREASPASTGAEKVLLLKYYVGMDAKEIAES
jgi:RNA polymerase sigma-70 factor (ECF subfamily)